MDFDFSDGERERYQRTIEFARGQLPPCKLGGEIPFDRAGWDQLARGGFCGLPLPEEFGGRGASALETSRQLEALTLGAADSGLVFSVCAHLFTCAVPIWKAGTDEQKRRFLAPLARGEWVGANGTTEAEVGSDMGSLAATAERRGDRYVLRGTKYFASNAPVANLFVFYASVNPAAGVRGLTAFIVERNAPGLRVLGVEDKIGLDGSPFGQVVLDDCEVPLEQRLGVEGAGSVIFAESMRWERSCLFALYLGVMQRQLDRSVAFAKERRQFGQSIGKFQSVANRLVDMKVRLDTARLLLYRAAWLLDHGRKCDLEISLSKLYASECAVQSGLDAIQIHGGRGCLTESGVEAALRDAIPSRIFSGTSEIQRLIVARGLGLG